MLDLLFNWVNGFNFKMRQIYSFDNLTWSYCKYLVNFILSFRIVFEQISDGSFDLMFTGLLQSVFSHFLPLLQPLKNSRHIFWLFAFNLHDEIFNFFINSRIGVYLVSFFKEIVELLHEHWLRYQQSIYLDEALVFILSFVIPFQAFAKLSKAMRISFSEFF